MVVDCLETLDRQFKECEAVFDLNWRMASKVEGRLNDLYEHLKLLDDMEEDVAAKRKTAEPFKGQIAAKELQLKAAHDRLSELQENLAELQESENQLKLKEKTRADKLDLLKKKQDKKEDEYGNAKEKSEVYVTRAKELLGLSIVKTTTDSTILTFTHVDKLDAEKQFLCEFTLTGPGNREYKVLRCLPEIEDIDSMEKKLNETNDLSSFACMLRKRFQTLKQQ